MNSEHQSLATTKRKLKQIAIDLAYPLSVQKALEKARSEEELNRVMRSARKGEYDE